LVTISSGSSFAACAEGNEKAQNATAATKTSQSRAG